jgi:hypothetical protein
MRLNVTAATRRTAILKLMIELRFLRVGLRLRIADIMRAWNRTGLRGDDLSAALNESLAAGILDFSGTGPEASVALTSAGASWIDSPEAKSEIAAQRPILDAALQRHRAGSDNQKAAWYERRSSFA